MNNSTSIQRISWLLVKDIRLKKNIYLLVLGGVVIIMLISFFNSNQPMLELVMDTINGSTRTPRGGNIQKFHLDWVASGLYLTGIIFTSISFLELSRMESKQFHLLLPARTWEKWLAKFLFTAVLLPIGFLIFYQLFAWCTYQWEEQLNFSLVHLSLFDDYVLKVMVRYFVFQCFAFLGAITFRQYSLLKGAFIVVGLYAFVAVLLHISSAIIIPELSKNIFSFGWSLSGTIDGVDHRHTGGLLDYVFNDVLKGFSTSVVGIVAITSLFLSYLKVKEMEA